MLKKVVFLFCLSRLVKARFTLAIYGQGSLKIFFKNFKHVVFKFLNRKLRAYGGCLDFKRR